MSRTIARVSSILEYEMCYCGLAPKSANQFPAGSGFSANLPAPYKNSIVLCGFMSRYAKGKFIVENRQDLIREKRYYRDKIAEMVGEIENLAMLEYLYIFIQGKVGKYVSTKEDSNDKGR